jgi:hypothetical protein
MAVQVTNRTKKKTANRAKGRVAAVKRARVRRRRAQRRGTRSK